MVAQQVVDRDAECNRGSGEALSSRTGSIARHIPTIVAIGAVALYGLGIVATAGQLRSTGLDVVQGMRLIPIEVHLRNGAGILVTPTFLLVVGLLLSVYAVTLAAARVPPPPSDSTFARYMRLWEGRAYPAFLVAVLVFIAVVAPWPAAASFTFVIASWFAVPHLQRYLGDRWLARQTSLYVLLVLVALGGTAMSDAYFFADPLPNATIKTTLGTVSGELIASDNGFLYLGPLRVGEMYRAIPADTVERVIVRRKTRPPDPTILKALGL